MSFKDKVREYDFNGERRGQGPLAFLDLKSVGCALEMDQFMVHPVLSCGGYDLDDYTELEDCCDEWFDRLSEADQTQILDLIIMANIEKKGGDFVVNNFLTINNFERGKEFKTIMKFGEGYKYQKFTGRIADGNVAGWICLRDNNIYDLKNI